MLKALAKHKRYAEIKKDRVHTVKVLSRKSDMSKDENDDEYAEDWRPVWRERGRATARLIQRCFKLLMDGPKTPPEKLHALCRLTWITKGNREVADNTRSVVIPALEVLLNNEFNATDKSSLRKGLLKANVPAEIVEAAPHDIGFVNFYSAFRNTSQKWIAANHDAVWRHSRSPRRRATTLMLGEPTKSWTSCRHCPDGRGKPARLHLADTRLGLPRPA